MTGIEVQSTRATRPVREVTIRPRPADAFASIVGLERVEETRRLAEELRRKLGGRTIWNVNSSAASGGVAEMLHTLLPYARGLGIDTRWLVIGGSPAFFRIARRIHDGLHGEPGDGSDLDHVAAEEYERVSEDNAAQLGGLVRRGDIVILHDPQTAGLAPPLRRAGARIVWRCHLGTDVRTGEGDRAWAFLEPYLTEAQAFVFSRFAYLPDILYHGRCLVLAPSIDPFSPKNQEMTQATVSGILVRLGLISDARANGSRSFTRRDGTTALVERRAEIVREGDPVRADARLVTQISRWDRLKDPAGVLRGFVRAIEAGGAEGAHLVLAGPAVHGAGDDAEGLEVFEELVALWRALPEAQRRRVHLVALPMDDVEENAAMVNALQRQASIVVQKSLREGFGLPVTEAMWKARPVIASAVGGIRDQVQHGVSGLLLKNPHDADAFAGSLRQLLGNRLFAERLGRNAKLRVTQNYLGLDIVSQLDDLVERLEQDPR